MKKVPFGKCDKCPLNNAILVPPELHNKSKVLFLAEAPGFHEAQEGRPLVGIAGQDFNRIIQSCGMEREDGNYTNAVLCRPTKVVDGKTYNRTPTNVEIQCCNDRLITEVEELQPIAIVCMGKISYTALGGDPKVAMKDVVGTKFTWLQKYNVIVTYHPAAIAHSGGVGTERGRLIRNEIEKAVKKALSIKHIDKQLQLFDIPSESFGHSKPILIEMELRKRACQAWWGMDTKKCEKCKQRFYCIG